MSGVSVVGRRSSQCDRWLRPAHGLNGRMNRADGSYFDDRRPKTDDRGAGGAP